MNDFFNVLDDFELEEFAPVGEPSAVSTFNLDVDGDSSSPIDPDDYGKDDIDSDSDIEFSEEKVTDVKPDKAAVTETGQSAWKDGYNPFRNGKQAGVSFSGGATTRTDGGTNEDLTYSEIDPRAIEGISFISRVLEAAAVVFKRTANATFGVEISGSAGVNIELNNGFVTGGSFAYGDAAIKLGRNYDAATAGGDIVIAVNGVSDNASWTGDELDVQTITTGGTTGEVSVAGDLDFSVDGHAIKVKNADEDSAEIVFSYDDGDIKLDLSSLVVDDADDTIQVINAGDADILVPPTDPDGDDKDGGSIIIAKKEYNYTLGTDSEAYFTLNDDGSVEGFVLDVIGDAITVGKNQDINVYDEDLVKLAEVEGSEYTITKQKSNYKLTIKETSEVTIGDTTLDFSIKSDLSDKPITILFDNDGNIESVDGLYNLTNANDKLVVTGPNATSAEEGLPVYASATAATSKTVSYISVSDGDFTLNGGKTQTLSVHSGDTVYASYVDVDLVTETSGGTVTDDISGITYAYGGKGYFVFDDEKGITGFVFQSANDYVTVPDAGEDLDLYYLTETAANKITIPATSDTEGFTVKLSDTSDAADPKFDIYNLTAGATVTATSPLKTDLVATDADDTITFDINGKITAIDDFEASDVVLVGDGVEHTIKINGDTLTYTAANDITIAGDGSKLVTVTGLGDGDVVYSSNPDTAFVFASDSTDGLHDFYTVNGIVYRVENDRDGVTITAGGVVTGLDEDAHIHASEGPVTVNGVYYSADDIATANDTGEQIIGFNTKSEDTLSSFVTDVNYPLFYSETDAEDIIGPAAGSTDTRWLNLTAFTGGVFRESNLDSFDQASNAGNVEVIFDGGVEGKTATFNNVGKNVAVVTDEAEGNKNIVLGNHGDAVIMQGDDEYGSVNITVGSGHDTIWVGGNMENDKVVHQANMKTNIDMGGTANINSVDKIHTYAAANANIELTNYDERGVSGVVLHDPEIPYASDIIGAIQDGLLLFEDGGITALDRDEFDKNQSIKEGTDRKTRIKVNNINENHQNMIRLFGYKDGKDTYGDDYGQLVGFTDKDGGTLDASDLSEDLVLIGNMNGDHTEGSYLKTGTGNDTVFAGGKDTIDTGDGVDLTVLDATEDREAATIIVGKGAGDVVQNVDSGFNGDIFDVTSFDGKLDYEFADSVLGIKDNSSKSTLLAYTDAEGEFIKQRFVNGSDTLYAAIAKEEGTITVTDADETVPNYYLAKDGAIDFSGFSGEVHMDVDGEDNDWSGPNQVGSTSNVTLGSSVNSLIGGDGVTIFKGGKGDETLVAGNGESSLYGGGGKNLLVGSTGEDKVESTEFFNIGIHNGAQNTITNFEFIADGGTNQATFDALNLGLSDNNDVTDIKANADGSVTVAIKGGESGATEKVTIADAVGKEFLVDRGTQTETVAQIAATEVTVNNSYVDFYCATDDANGATVKVGDIAATEIWLDAPDYGNGVDFSNSKFTVVDARGSNAEVLIAGNDLANTIYGGAGNASMWGGSGIVNDVMYAGTGHNEFYFEAYNGNDTIIGAKDGDVIQLGVTLDQIDFDNTNVTATGVEIKLTDGSSLTVEGTGNVDIVLDDGTTAKVNHATQSFE